MKNIDSLVRTSISLLLLSIGVGGYLWMGESQVETRPPAEQEAPLVTTTRAVEHDGGIQFVADGVVVPFRQVEIAAEVSGRIEFKAENCRTGRTVKAGELLVRIEKRDYELDVMRLKEEVAQAGAMINELVVETSTVENQISKTEEQLEIDARQVVRNQDLRDRRAASNTEVDVARRTELTTESSLQSMRDQKSLLVSRRARLESAKMLGQANQEMAELALQRTEIHAPFDGIVVTENVEQDGYVQTGSTVISLQDTSQLDVTCKLHMRQMNWLWQGRPYVSPESTADTAEEAAAAKLAEAYDFPDTPAKIMFRLGSTTYQWEGAVDRYDGAGLDSQTRMVPCRVHVADPAKVKVMKGDDRAFGDGTPPTLMTGMFVKVKIEARPPIPLVRLPQEAIQPRNRVWTVNDEGQLESKEISIVTSDSEYVVVSNNRKDGLSAGDLVVISPMATAIEGMKVKTQSSEEAARAGKVEPASPTAEASPTRKPSSKNVRKEASL